MRLYMVRLIRNKEAVGLFWSRGSEDLWSEVDEVTDPFVCEWAAVTTPCAVVWPTQTSITMGIDRDNDDENCMEGAESNGTLYDLMSGERRLRWKPFPDAMTHLGYPA